MIAFLSLLLHVMASPLKAKAQLEAEMNRPGFVGNCNQTTAVGR
jgi:hypothetical protein